MRNKDLTMLIWLLKIGAVMTAIMAASFALVMATFATDAPSSSQLNALFFGLGVFVVLGIPFVGFPLWAARRVEKFGAEGTLPAIVFGVCCLLSFPLGTALAVAIFTYVRRARAQARE